MKSFLNISIILIISILSTSVTNRFHGGSTEEKEGSIALFYQHWENNKLGVLPLSATMAGLYEQEAIDSSSAEYQLNVPIPLVQNRYYKRHQIKHIKQRMSRIYHNYGKYIKNASAMTKVPESLIASIIFIESNGNTKSLNKKSGATGLMQLTQASCSDILYLKNKSGQLTEKQVDMLKKTLGARLDCILSMQHMGQKMRCNGKTGYNVNTEDLLKPEFNILCGAIFLSILIENHTEKGTIRLDRIVAGYNIGLFSKVRGKTPEDVMRLTNQETRTYIQKLAGKNGVLEVMSI